MHCSGAVSSDACDGVAVLPQASLSVAVSRVEIPFGIYRPCRSIRKEWDRVEQSNDKPGHPSPLQYPGGIAQGAAPVEARLRQVTPKQSRKPATSCRSLAEFTGDEDDEEAETGSETDCKPSSQLSLDRHPEVDGMDSDQQSKGSATDRENTPHDSMTSDRGCSNELERAETRHHLAPDDRNDPSSQHSYPVPTTPPTPKPKRPISREAVRCPRSVHSSGPREQAEAVRQTHGQGSRRHHRRRRHSTPELEDGDSYCPSESEAQQDEESDGPPLPLRKRRKPLLPIQTPPSQAADGQLAVLGAPRLQPRADRVTLSMDREDSGHDEVVSRASFEEWPLKDAVLKCATVDGVTTFQLQFSWNSCSGHKQRAFASGSHESHVNSRPRHNRFPFTAAEDKYLTKGVETSGLDMDRETQAFQA